MNWCPGPARFLAMPLIYRVLLISTLLFGVLAPMSAEAQGSFGIGGYLVRPEQDVDHDPSSIDPNATDTTPEILKRKRQRQNQGQPTTGPQPQNQVEQERPAQNNPRDRGRERAEEADRARKARARERAEEAERARKARERERAETRQNRKTRSGQARDEAAPGTSARSAAPASGGVTPPPRQDANTPVESESAEKGTPSEVPAPPNQLAAPVHDDEAEKAVKSVELIQDGARAVAEDVVNAHMGALNAGETTVAVQNTDEAVALAGNRAKGGKDTVKDTAVIIAATVKIRHNPAVQQTAEKTGTELALRQPAPAVAQGENDTAKQAPTSSPLASSPSAETGVVSGTEANNTAPSAPLSEQNQPQIAEKTALLSAPEIDGLPSAAAAHAQQQPSQLAATDSASAAAPSAPPAREQPAPAADPLDKMIGQMLMVGFEGTTPEDPSVRKLAAQIASGQVGSVLFLGHNIVSPQQLKTLNAYLRDANPDLPVLLAIDQEGGIVQRLSHNKGFPEFPSAGQLGQANDPLNAYTVYERMAAELTAYGFNLNLGPVVDLSRAESSVITGQERSFGDQPRHVAAFAKAFCVAHRTAGVLTALKHFPGHGSATGDTHDNAVDVSETWQRDELAPYRELIGAGVADVVMTGHIAHHDWSDTGLPASLSQRAIEMLRGELGFNGVIITDDLEMGAVSKQFSPEEASIRAIKAGNDIIMLSNKAQPSLDLPDRITAAIREAVRKGDLTREQIERSHERVIALKQKLRSLNSKLTAKHDGATEPTTPPQ